MADHLLRTIVLPVDFALSQRKLARDSSNQLDPLPHNKAHLQVVVTQSWDESIVLEVRGFQHLVGKVRKDNGNRKNNTRSISSTTVIQTSKTILHFPLIT